jgi:hypothetical protein
MEAVALNLAAAHDADKCRAFYRTSVRLYEAGAASVNTQTGRPDPGTERELLADADRIGQMFGWRDLDP